VLEGCSSLDEIQAARRFNPALRASLEPYSDEAVLTRLKSMSGGGTQIDVAEDPRIAEFQPARHPLLDRMQCVACREVVNRDGLHALACECYDTCRRRAEAVFQAADLRQDTGPPGTEPHGI
jgi:hypothetical protein